MRTSRQFLRATGIAGVGAGLITFLIWSLPALYGPPASFTERVELHTNALYMADQWLSFLNVFLILLASWGLAAQRLSHSPGAASTGMLFILFYGTAELLGRSVMVFVREYRWTHQLLNEEDPTRAAFLRGAIRQFDDVWGGLFGLLLIAFICSASLFAVSLRGGLGLQRLASWGLALAAGLGAVTLLAVYFPSGATRTVARWGYPLVQPASRILIGLWLLQQARETCDLAKS
jgi:hypothetical protein